MIKHIVLFTFKSDITPNEINSVFNQLRHLTVVLPSLSNYSYGENCSPEHLNKGFTHAFIMDFDDAKARDAYLHHEEHQRIVRDVILPLLENGTESALVLDYEF